jgi:hypothetical protein
MSGKKDYAWNVEFTREAPHDLNDPTQKPTPWNPPKVTVTGVNVEAICRNGTIQLRRFPTGILLEKVECLFHKQRDGDSCEYFLCKLHNSFEVLSHEAKLGQAFADGVMKQFKKFDLWKEEADG